MKIILPCQYCDYLNDLVKSLNAKIIYQRSPHHTLSQIALLINRVTFPLIMLSFKYMT
jgi:hypothetical protein